MKLQKRTIPIKRKRARPLAEVHKSLLHQATKALAKTVKLVKGFMIQKCSRKITDLKEPPEGKATDTSGDATKLANELEFLQSLKNIDSAVFGSYICNTKLSIGNKELTSEVDQTIVDLVVQQSRIISALKETETAIAAAVLKNNTLRADEQSRDAKKVKSKAILEERKARGETIVKVDKGLLAERKVNGKERKAAVFLDTLEDGSAPVSKTKKKVIERVKILKNLRNKQNRSANKSSSGEGGGHDRDVYMPMNKRSGAGATAASSSTSSFKRKVRLYYLHVICDLSEIAI
jgi:RNase P/RNase MRP subunit p29